jgi:RadC-like JAB domain-containing protein
MASEPRSALPTHVYPTSGVQPSADSYEGSVRATLVKLGSPNPDGELIQTGDFWKHCQAAGIAPENAAAVIYSTTRHKHGGSTSLREGASEAPGAAPDPLGEYAMVQRMMSAYAAGRGLEYTPNTAIPTGRVVDGDGEWRFWASPRGGGKSIEHTVRNSVLRHQGTSEAGASQAESPTALGQEWEVIVKRVGSMDAIKKAAMSAAGRKPDEVSGHNVIFGDFYDDEKARAFARQMTNAGFIAMYGPRRAVAAESSNVEEKGALRWTEVWFEFPTDAMKFATWAEKINSTIVASATNRIVRTNAAPGDIEKVLKKHRWRGRHILDAETMAAEAREMAPVISEAKESAPVIHEGHIPWVKVERDPKVHEGVMALNKKHGAINGPLKVYELVGPALSKETAEVFLVIPLNLRGELAAPVYEVARGQISSVTVKPNDVMDAVHDARCEGFIVVHNHPSGKCNPSKADRNLTIDIKDADRKKKYIDHCVVGNGQIYSIEEGKAYKI